MSPRQLRPITFIVIMLVSNATWFTQGVPSRSSGTCEQALSQARAEITDLKTQLAAKQALPNPVRAEALRALRTLRSVSLESSFDELQRYYLDARVKVDAADGDKDLAFTIEPYSEAVAQWRNSIGNEREGFDVRKGHHFRYAAKYPKYAECMASLGAWVGEPAKAPPTSTIAPHGKEMSGCLLVEANERVKALF